MHLLPRPGVVAIQLRTTVKRLAVGAGLARKQALVEQLRRLSRLPVVTSPAGGTIVLTGPGVLGFAAIGVPPSGVAFGIDWMMSRVEAWFGAALAAVGVDGKVTVGKIDGAWCPGFSDIAVDGRKLVGVGFRVTRDWVVIRGVVPIQSYSDEEVEILAASHALLGVAIRPATFTSVQAESSNPASIAQTLEVWRSVVTR